jgi:hypothetical protein
MEKQGAHTTRVKTEFLFVLVSYHKVENLINYSESILILDILSNEVCIWFSYLGIGVKMDLC